MLRQLFKDVAVNSDTITVSHDLGVIPEFVNVAPKFHCGWRIVSYDDSHVIIEFTNYGGFVDVYIAVDHSIIK